MKMKLMRTRLILNLLISFSFYIIINASPTLNRRQDGSNLVTPKSNLLQPLKPLDATPQPVTREYQLELSRVQLSPDGFERTVWSANGQYPGPTIEANKGDRLVIHIKNNLQDNCTIHWHGIFQIGTSYFDGVTGQTQCVIKDGDTFIYNFTTGEQYGTYWWHSHYRSQYMDGLRGPLIVYDPRDPFAKEYDYEYIMTVSDWYHDHAEDLFAERTKPGYGGTNPVPDSGLISGFGRYDCSRAPPGSKCTPNAPIAVYSVEKGKRYRFRIINTSGEAPYIVSIDEHPLRIIEVEGEYVQPIVLNKLSIAIGQRYSVIVTCDKDVKNFWIRAHIVRECLDTNSVTINHDSAINFDVTGILRYQGAPEEDPNTADWDEPGLTCRDVDHNILELLTPRDAPGPVTDNLTFYISFSSENGVPVGMINNSTFLANIDKPSISRVFAGGDYVGKKLDPDQNAYYYDTENGVVEVTLINQSGAMHPFHLHGHNFYIMGSNQGDTPDPTTYDMYPSVRDTISVPDDSWAVIRFRIDNPGVWAFHCHIDWHASMGMIGQLIERPSVLQNMQLPPGICPQNT